MDIFLSINNREEVLRFPIIPPKFCIISSSNFNSISNINKEQMLVLGDKKLKTISWESFFPFLDCEISKNKELKGFEFSLKIEEFIKRKLPMRLIITSEEAMDGIVNIPVLIEEFEYGMKDGSKDVYYKIKFKEYNILEDNQYD